MKVHFNRLNGLFKRAHFKVKDPRDSRADPISPSPSARFYQKGKLLQLPPLPEWPPPPPPLEQLQRGIGTSTSITLYKPLPELSLHTLPLIEGTLLPFGDYDPTSISHSRSPLSDVVEEDSVEKAVVTSRASPRADQDSAETSSRKTGNACITTTNGSNGVPKKVASLPPPPIPSGPDADRPLPEDASTSNNTTVVRSQTSHPKKTRGPKSTAASGSRPNVGSSQNSTQTVDATSKKTRSVTSPNSPKPAYGDGASIDPSLRSATPSSIGSVLPAGSRSEGVEEDGNRPRHHYCKECKRHFDSDYSKMQHMKAKHWYCGKHDRIFKSEGSLESHYRESGDHIYCAKCKINFDNDDKLWGHLEEEHHACAPCRKQFVAPKDLEQHNQQVHRVCTKCQRSFRNAHDARQHANSCVHQEESTLRCPGAGCGRTFVSPSALAGHFESGACTSHMTRDRLDRLVVLADRKNYVTQRWATQRMWNGTAYECPMCSDKFDESEQLSRHLQSPRHAHTDDMYKCPDCAKEFAMLSALCGHFERGSCGAGSSHRVREAMDSWTRLQV